VCISLSLCGERKRLGKNEEKRGKREGILGAFVLFFVVLLLLLFFFFFFFFLFFFLFVFVFCWEREGAMPESGQAHCLKFLRFGFSSYAAVLVPPPQVQHASTAVFPFAL